MRHYIAIIRKEKGTCYGVDFPDFPGCVTAADTVEEAQARAVEALDLHVDGMVEDGEPLPEATGLDAIIEDPDSCNGMVLAVQVPLADKKSKKVRVDITIPEDLSRQVDRFVKGTEGLSRSSFFATAGVKELQRTTAHIDPVTHERGGRKGVRVKPGSKDKGVGYKIVNTSKKTTKGKPGGKSPQPSLRK